jgi:hypothetical protein
VAGMERILPMLFRARRRQVVSFEPEEGGESGSNKVQAYGVQEECVPAF